MDTKSRELVGIELKAKWPDQGIVAQAAKYMTALKHRAEADGLRGARLMIITGQPNAQLADQVQVQAENIGVKCEWLLYSVRFELKNPHTAAEAVVAVRQDNRAVTRDSANICAALTKLSTV
ncbi:hypothetical protein ABQF26_02380 [Mycolicibacterium elephantis]